MPEATVVDDRSLLDAIIAGDPSAPWSLWQRHAAELYALCFREMKRHKADAEDALAQSMLKAIVKLPRFAAGIVSARGWLRQLTRNVCRDIQREQARARQLAMVVWSGGLSARRTTRRAESPPLHEPSSADAYMADGNASFEPEDCEPAMLLERLPERLREVFALRVLQQMRYSEIAARLQLTSVAARKRVQQARRLVHAWRNGNVPLQKVRACPTNCTQPREIPLVVHAVRVRLPSGKETTFEILVRRRPSREHQKIATLRAYVERHPRGWKKRLALADLLYETGAWTEAMDAYRFVLHKRPWLEAVAKRIDDMTRELEKFT